jgi:hypothetical protein
MAFGPFFMFSRSLCEKAGYLDEQMRTSADFDLAIRLSYHARILAVDHILGYYLMERKGLSTNASTKRFIEDTVIGLRYGNFDHLYYDKIPQALDYDIGRVNSDDRWTEVSDCVPNYRYERRKRMMRSVCKGPFNYVKKQIQWRKRMLDFESSQ